MKVLKYKILALVLLLTVSLQAQTFDKKINESFKVNSNVELEIEANHTDVIIEVWNRNIVAVESVMEVEGVSKEEADKLFSKWGFETLGNKSKVRVVSKSENMNFDFNFSDIDIDIPEFDFEIPEINFEMPELPEMPEMEEIEFDYQAYKNDSTYLKKYKKKVSIQVEKFKRSDWKQKMDSVRNSEEYKRSMEEVKRASKKIASEIKEFKNSEEFKQAMDKAKNVSEKYRVEMHENKELWEEQVKLAKEAPKMAVEMVEKMKRNGTLDSIQNFSENVYFNLSEKNNSKIKKYIKIKAPKNATFKLNVRHGKLNIPDSNKKMSVIISYGNFIGGTILGDSNKLNISNSPIKIDELKSATITLKNVSNAMFGTFENVNLFSDYSDVVIDKVGKNNALSNKFGNIEIVSSVVDFEQLNLILDYSKAIIDLSNPAYNYHISNKKSTLNLNDNLIKVSDKTNQGVQIIDGYNLNNTTSNKLFLTSVYSSLIMN